MANTYHNYGNYNHYQNRKRPNIQMNTPKPPKDIPLDLPPQPCESKEPKHPHGQNPQGALGELLQTLNINTLDKDRLILLALMYLLYKEDKKNLKLILALGYILL